jgi:hemolysin activation/secretion protein
MRPFNLFRAIPLVFLAFSVGLAGRLPSTVRAEPAAPVFRLRHLLIADTRGKAEKMAISHGRTGIWDVPLLGTEEFDSAMDAYFGKPITPEMIERLKGDLTAFVKRKGQQLVDVMVPDQNISGGELRLVVVIGHYDLTRLVITNDEKTAATIPVPADAHSIMVQDVPVVETQEFSAVCAPFFGKPITEEWINDLVARISAYTAKHGQILAKVYIPTQSIDKGEFRMALTIGRYPVKRLIFSDTLAKAAAIRPRIDSGRIVTENLPLLATPEFSRFISPYFDQPISIESVERLRNDVTGYLKKHDLLVVDVPQPMVDPASGELRIGVQIGRYSQLVFKGNRYFSNDLLMKKLGIKPGDEVRYSTLEDAVNWTNQNPFRQIQVMVNTVGKQPGIADLDVSVQERLPVQIAASFDDTGNSVIGENHYTASILFGNLWNSDQQLSYQYTTSKPRGLYELQSLDYRAPLPWHHYVEFTAAYADVKPVLFSGFGSENSRNVVADGRYIVPVKLGSWKLEMSAGFDYKQVRTDLLFGGYEITSAIVPAFTPYDIAQITGSVTAIRADSRGKWTFATFGDESPGGFNSRNSDGVFGAVREGGESHYLYDSLQAVRETDLPHDFQLFTRGQAQLSTANLPPSEELSIGGLATIRGYDERIFSGDQGWVVSQEIRGPAVNWHPWTLPKNWRSLQTRPIVFWDYGRVYYKHPSPADYPIDPLMSSGVGIISNLASNFSLSADYGWQILHTYMEPDPMHRRGHIQLTVAY